MEVTGTQANALYGSAVSKESANLKQVFRSAPADDVVPAERADKSRRGRGADVPGLALGALRQEIRAALTQKFKLAISTALGSYTPTAPSSSDVASEALGAAGRLAGQDPLSASEQLKALREDVEAAGDAVKGLIGDDDLDDVEDAIAKISQGLDEADDDAARNTVASASFLSAESVLKQSSKIRIRTQEGDVVTLDLRRRESFSATDVAVQGAGGSFTSTEVEASSKSRLVLNVRGDINAEELAAIQGVFEQAEAIAADFFGGDIAAAFEAASGLAYDSEQLSRVSLRFREREVTNVSFAQASTFTSPVAQPVISDTPEPVVAAQSDAVTPAERAPLDVAAELVKASVEAAAPEDVAEPDGPVAAAPVEVPVANEEAASDAFAETLSAFLRSTLEGFETGGEQRFFYSESFRLKLLKTAIEVSAPDGGETAAQNAASVIDAIADDTDD